ncbi:MAG: hypothetical protein EOO50_07080 [Flavobacterium sp.]|uniref:XAC2610-related protein n=1 Tax=Flavobacterium sp. TaxID=239 RepID=UPI001221E408|nr:hypothetical protein [Flavobacterium sp.]RZJ67019.1 MAG: hypothetical protein EOO50_07080 [Flavobacterium sp.]
MKIAFGFLAVLVLFFACSDAKPKYVAVQKSPTPKQRIDTVYVKDSVVSKERLYDNLSKTQNFKLTYFEKSDGKKPLQHFWTIVIYDKKMKRLDSIVQPVYVLLSSMVDLNNVRSYATGINENMQAPDNYYGDFVVADFNFDAKNDFAILNDMGGNGGPFYSFYIQQQDKTFSSDRFLQDSMTYFPTKIDKQKQQLVTYVHAGVCWVGEHKYEKIGNGWKQVSHKRIDVCDDTKKSGKN